MVPWIMLLFLSQQYSISSSLNGLLICLTFSNRNCQIVMHKRSRGNGTLHRFRSFAFSRKSTDSSCIGGLKRGQTETGGSMWLITLHRTSSTELAALSGGSFSQNCISSLVNLKMCKMHVAIYSGITLLLLIIKNSGATVKSIKMAVDPDSSIYYDFGGKTKLAIEEVDASRIPLHPIRFISRGLPCSCVNWACGCCSGINITIINFNRLTCTNITFVPEEFAMDFFVSMDDDIVMENRLTARNPPPICVPLYFLPLVSFCVRFFDLHVNGNRFKTCIDFETRINQWTIFILHFNCLTFGGDGVSWDNPTATSVNVSGADSNKTEIYNVVNSEEANGDAYYLYTNTSKLDRGSR